ncbi:MAG: hypothetical protein V4649_09015 [Bacteroidota bacterium]
MNNHWLDAAKTFLLALGYSFAVILIQYFFNHIELSNHVPDAVTLKQWDAPIYQNAARLGYYYHDEKDNNMGIFILFPWVWRLLHVGILGICISNIIFFSAAFTIITRIYPVPSREKLLWLTTPLLYFMWVPYTEALFCLLIAILFYGMVRHNKPVIVTSLIVVSLCRPTTAFLTPALLVAALLSSSKQNIGQSLKKYLLLYALPTLIGTAIFVLYQYSVSHVWFPYYKGQAKYLGHVFSLPTFPFSSCYGGQRIKWIGGLAMVPCTIAIVVLARKALKWLRKDTVYPDEVWLLTLGYLPLVMGVMVFFSPTWGTLTTNLISIHRYVFCSPFFFVFLYHMVSKPRTYRAVHFITAIVVCNIVWLSMGSYKHFLELLFYNVLTVLVVLYMVHANNKQSWAALVICGFNIFIQIHLFQQYMAGLFTE